LIVVLTTTARNWLADVGYDPSFGARPLRRALQKHVESPLSVSLLSGQFTTGNTILVDVDPDSNTLVFRLAEQQIPAEQVNQVNV
jgi:ATP-dependent Clp protease ATP-binding subunit ClpC